jgi:hypothetical protein
MAADMILLEIHYDSILGIQPQYYGPIFYSLMLLFVIIQVSKLSQSSGRSILSKRQPSDFTTAAFPILLMIFFGLRPISGYYFGDTSTYLYSYNTLTGDSLNDIRVNTKEEWLWIAMQTVSHFLHLSVNGFFIIVAAGYIGLMYWTCRRFMPSNVWIAMLFCMTAFSFYSYGINGIRNGLACSMTLLAFSFFLDADNKQGKIIAIIIVLLAMGIHRTVMLPAICMLIAYFLIKDTKQAIGFWAFSIVLSLVAGTAVSNFFAGLGFDDRMAEYLVNDKSTMSQFSNTGFRWDFLLYSAMPIWLGYYITVTRGIKDKVYSLLINTYILCNAFWVMVINASFSNRFAYLSWFMYPIVLAYPLLKVKIWRDQDRKTAYILLAQEAFTFFMWIIGK